MTYYKNSEIRYPRIGASVLSKNGTGWFYNLVMLVMHGQVVRVT